MRIRHVFALLIIFLGSPAFLLTTRAGLAQPSSQSSPPSADDPRRIEAKKHFDVGVEHSDRAEWDAALVEFLASRAILPTTKNTYNAAVSLRKLQRFDEALEMYETFLREFPDASPQEKQVAEKELAALKASVGTIELKGVPSGAKIVVDSRDRGTFPLQIPLRVGAGRHTVRVLAEGYLPFESSIDVSGLAVVPLEVRLATLTAAGRLRVTEQTSRAGIDVVLDGAVVGQTPWEGAVSPGSHTVLLKGKDNNLGTQPVRPTVTLNQSVSLNLLAEVLDASVRIEPLPTSSTIALDGVELGRGAWEGRLRPGAHVVTANAEGFLPYKQSFDLKKDATEVIAVKLERDPKSALFAQPSPSIVFEGNLALPIGLLVGGDLGDAACGGPCSASVPIGFRGVVHGTYQLGSGLGFGVDVGYLLAVRSIEGRATNIEPKGRPPNNGTANDDLRLSALTLGASAQYHRVGTGDWPLTFRLGAGVLLGNTRDERSGSFTNSLAESYSVSLRESSPATYLYVAPDVRIGRALTKHLEINAGMEILLMTAIVQPTWKDKSEVLTGRTNRGDGLGIFGEQTMLGSALLFISPGVGLRYEL
jgi:hypothetical protein